MNSNGMNHFIQISPPSTPPKYTTTHCRQDNDDRFVQKSGSSYTTDSNKTCLEYVRWVKSGFQQLTCQQKSFFLQEILGCCDSQLLQSIYAFIAPKLRVDFLKELPIELSLHILSFIEDPKTLARASIVSRHWNMLLTDETAWKKLYFKHQYQRFYSSFSIQQQNRLLLPGKKTTTILYRDFFRRKYSIDTAWNQGGDIATCEDYIGSELATSLQMDDTFVVVGCDNNRILVFDTTNGRHIRTLSEHQGGVWALQFIKNKSNEHILVTGGCDRVARVWDLSTGVVRHTLRGHVSTIRCLKVKDEKTVVTGSRDATLRIWDIETGELRHVCAGHASSVRCIDIYDNKVVSGSYDATARLWDIETGQCLHTFVGHRSQIYAIAFDGTRVVTGSLDSSIRVWSADTGHCLKTLLGHTSLVGHLQLSAHNNLLISGSSDGCVRIWDMKTYECKHRIIAHDSSVTGLQYDNNRILSAGSDGIIKLWDADKGVLIRSFTETAKAVWKMHMNETKAVVILQRNRNSNYNSGAVATQLQTVMELHNFDVADRNAALT